MFHPAVADVSSVTIQVNEALLIVMNMKRINFIYLFLFVCLSCSDSSKEIILYESGEKKSSGLIVNSLKEGLWTTWHKNGIKESEGRYNNGRKTHEWKLWTSAGVLIEYSSWQDNQLSGNYMSYYNDGRLKSEGTYSFGKKIFYWNYYDSVGVKTVNLYK
jgi:antitoxin component YwqK of YwqJK toxin-antitoxin module